MRIEFTLKNYRCFPDSYPARFVIEDDWAAFVGVNNAGKSSLLRFFYEFRNFFSHLTDMGHWQNLMGNGSLSPGYGDSVRDPAELFHNQNQRDMTIEVCVSPPKGFSQPNAPVPTSVTFEVLRNDPTKLRLTQLTYIDQMKFPLDARVRAKEDRLVTREGTPEVHMLLYCQAMQRLASTYYVGAFRNVLNTGAKSDYFDIQVGDAFVTRWRSMQTGNELRANQACDEVVAAIERLFGFDRLEIRDAASGDTLQFVIDRKPYKLHELGAGIAQFILVMANAAFRRPSYILIDEPELNLHPSLQLDFLTELGKFAQHGVLFTTHSIGLARAAADRVYSVVRERQGVSKVGPYEAIPNLSEFLGALSYSSYQALGFDKVLLVEGPTEVKAVQQFLRKLRKDHQVLLIHLGGSSTIKDRSEHELGELKRITPRLHALIDSEKPTEASQLPPEREAFRTTCRNLDIECHVLDRRAIENYFPEYAIRQVKGDKYRQLGPYEALKDVNPAWGKQENWRIAGETTWEDIKDTDLGLFLGRL